MDSNYVRTGGGYVCRFCNMKTRQLTSSKQKEDSLKDRIAFLEMQLQEKEKIISENNKALEQLNKSLELNKACDEDGILRKIEVIDGLISRLNIT